MNFKKILVLVMATLMILVAVPSCGGTKMIKVKLTVTAGDDAIFSREIEIKPSSDKGASVLAVVNQACDKNGLEATLTADGNGVESFKGDYDYVSKTVGDYTYTWTYTIDGAAAKSGKAADNYVTDGQTIAYTLVYFDNTEEKIVTENYESELGVYGENDDEDIEDDEDEDIEDDEEEDAE